MVFERLNRPVVDWLPSSWGASATVIGVALGAATAVLARFSLMWSGLILVGLSILVCSLTVRDPKAYWLGIFALVLPLEIKKMLVDSSFVKEFVKQYGFPTGELPGPVLYLSDLPLLALCLLWSVDVLLRRQPVRFPKAHWLSVALLVWSALSMVNARDVASAFFDLCRGAKFYLLYVLVYNVLDVGRRIRVLMLCLLAGVVLQGSLCLLHFVSQGAGTRFTLVRKDTYSADFTQTMQSLSAISEGGLAGKRASGTVGPNNTEALYFEQLLPMAFLMWQGLRRSADRTLAWCATVLGALGLLVTFSRGGIIGLIAGTVALLVLSWFRTFMPRRRILMVALFGTALLVMAVPVAKQYFGTRPEGASSRIHLMKMGLQMVSDHPLLGVGLNNHLQAKTDYDLRSYALQLPTHNYFVLVASQIGIPGFVLFLGFLWSVWQSALRASRSDDPLLVAVALGTAAALISIVVHSQFDIIGTHTNLSLLWLFAGVVAVLEARVSASRPNLVRPLSASPEAVNG